MDSTNFHTSEITLTHDGIPPCFCAFICVNNVDNIFDVGLILHKRTFMTCLVTYSECICKVRLQLFPYGPPEKK